MFIKLSPSRCKCYLASFTLFLVFVIYLNQHWFSAAFKETFIYSPSKPWCPRCHPVSFLSTDLLRLTTTPTTNHPSACSSDPLAIIIVTSAPKNRAKRNQLRRTWIPVARKLNMSILFGIGFSKEKSEIERENAENQDILEWSFLDSWRNLTLKSIALILWHQNHCLTSKFLIKADDDAVINPKMLHNYLLTLDDSPVLVGQLLRSNGPCFGWWKQRHCMQKTDHKMLNYMKYYPPYPAGPMYILSRSSVSILKEKITQSSTLKLYFMEDVFVTLMAIESKIRVVDNKKFYFCGDLNERNFESQVKNAIVMYDCSSLQIQTIWDLINE